MNVVERLTRLELNYDLRIDEKIQAMFADGMTAIKNRNWLLPLERQTDQTHFDGERLFIERFEKAGSELAMNTNQPHQ